MEFTLTDVEDEFVHTDPFVRVSLQDRGDRISIEAGGECTLHYIKMLMAAIDVLAEEEMTDEEREELDSWLDGE